MLRTGKASLVVFPLAVLLVFLVLAALYESWILPLAVILIVPLSLLAALTGVWLTGGDNNIFVQVGLVVLMGLACKNAILIVEFARDLELQGGNAMEPLRWIRAQVGQTLRLIAVDEIDYLRSDSKYTLIAWRGDNGEPAEALVRTPLKELAAQLDPGQFAQVHRSAIVNLRAISHVKRGDNETADIHLKSRTEVLPVSRNFLHFFKQM